MSLNLKAKGLDIAKEGGLRLLQLVILSHVPLVLCELLGSLLSLYSL